MRCARLPKGWDPWEIGLNDFKSDDKDVKWRTDRGIRVFSFPGDHPPWWKRISEPEIAGFKADRPEACTDRWMENFGFLRGSGSPSYTDEKRSGQTRTVFTGGTSLWREANSEVSRRPHGG